MIHGLADVAAGVGLFLVGLGAGAIWVAVAKRFNLESWLKTNGCYLCREKLRYMETGGEDEEG